MKKRKKKKRVGWESNKIIRKVNFFSVQQMTTKVGQWD
jgi:hypothetical protein